MPPTRKKTPKQPARQPVSDRSEDDEDYRKKRSRNNEVRMYYAYFVTLKVFRFGLFFDRTLVLKILNQNSIRGRENFIKSFVFFKFQAVKRSRVKQKQRTSETKGRVDNLRRENTKLEGRIEQKEKELKLLKGLFLEAAQIKSNSHPHLNLQQLLQDNDDDADVSTAGT